MVDKQNRILKELMGKISQFVFGHTLGAWLLISQKNLDKRLYDIPN